MVEQTTTKSSRNLIPKPQLGQIQWVPQQMPKPKQEWWPKSTTPLSSSITSQVKNKKIVQRWLPKKNQVQKLPKNNQVQKPPKTLET